MRSSHTFNGSTIYDNPIRYTQTDPSGSLHKSAVASLIIVFSFPHHHTGCAPFVLIMQKLLYHSDRIKSSRSVSSAI